MKYLVATACLAGLASVYADVDTCIDTINDPTGLTYNGKVRTTVSGFKCARWGFALKKLAQNGTIKKQNVIGGVRHNNCRNPDGDANGPWCFTLDKRASSNWEYCDIEECDRDEYYNYDDDQEYDEEYDNDDDSSNDSYNDNNNNNNNNNSENVIPECGIKGKQRSRRQTDSFIVNGEQAFKGELPWQVHLRSNTGSYKGSGFCGGSILNDRWILTASHCILDKNGNEHQPAYSISIAVGWFDAQGTDPSSEDRAQGADFIPVKRIITHPEYDTTNFSNDIALIELTRPIQFSGDLVRPICLPTAAFEDQIESENFQNFGTCLVSGWGDTRGNPAYSSELLAKAEMPVITNLQCGQKLGWGDYELPDYAICAMHQGGGQDSCQGDSGGPLVCESFTKGDGRFAQLGVVSWGYDCGKDSPGVYARTSTFTDWIKFHAGNVQFI